MILSLILEADFEIEFVLDFEVDFEIDVEVNFGVDFEVDLGSNFRIRLRSAYDPLTIRAALGSLKVTSKKS